MGAHPKAAHPPLAAVAEHSVPPRVADTAPVRLLIPGIAVDAVVEARGLDGQRNLETPRDSHEVAWYDQGPRPGQPGNSIINGHVNWWTGSAVFARLGELRPGDEVVVIRQDGSRASFKVSSRRILAATARDASLFAPSTASTLTLITCAGPWDLRSGSDTERLLVSATLA